MKKEKVDMIHVLSQMDSDTTSLEDVQRTLGLFSEVLGGEVDNIDPSQPWTAVCFKARFDNVRSTLTLIQHRLANVLDEMKSAVDEGYRLHNGENK